MKSNKPSQTSAGRPARSRKPPAAAAAPGAPPDPLVDESIRLLFDTMSQGVIFRDSESRAIAVNPAAERILGISRDQLLGKAGFDLPGTAVREDGSAIQPGEYPGDIVLRTGKTIRGFVMGISDPADGSRRWISVTAEPLFRPGASRPHRAYILFEDITAAMLAAQDLRESHKQLEQEVYDRTRELSQSSDALTAQTSALKTTQDRLRESEAKFRRLAEQAADLIYLYRIRPERKYEYISPSAAPLTGYTPEEFYANPLLGLQLVHAEDLTKLRELESAPVDPVKPLVLRMVRKDGRIIWTEHRDIIIRDAAGRVVAIQGIARDITDRIVMEEKLRDSEKFLQAIINTEPECVKMLAADGTLLMINPAGITMLGADTLEQVRGQCIYQIITPEHRPAFIRMTEAVFQGKSGILAFQAVGLSGRTIWLETHAVPLRDERQQVFAALGITRDITEQKKMEERLRRSEAVLRDAQRVAGIGSWERDIRTQEVRWSEQTFRILGVDPQSGPPPTFELFVQTIHPQDRQQVQRALEDALKRNIPYDAEFRLLLPDGSLRIVHSRAEIAYDASGAPVRLFGTIQDLTDRRRAEDLLPRIAAKISEKTGDEYFRSVVEFIVQELGTDIAFIAERMPAASLMRTVVLFANGRISPNIEYAIANTPCENVVGKTSCFHPDRMRTLFPADRLLQEMEVESYAGIPLFDFQGAPLGAIVTLGRRPMRPADKDRIIMLLQIFAGRVSAELARSQSLLALQASEQRYRQLLESVTSYLYTVQVSDGKAVSTVHGPGCAAVTGYTSEDYAADPYLWYRMAHHDDQPLVLAQAERVLRGEPAGPLEHRIRHKNGSLIWVRNTIVPRHDDQGRLAAYDGLITDITERRHSEEFTRSILESVDEGFVVIDRGFKIINVNRAFCAFIDRRPEDVIGKHCHDVVHRMYAPCYEQGEECAVRNAFATGQPHSVVHLHHDADGNPITVETKAFPLRNEAGEVIAAIEIINDVTEKKRLADQLHHAQKMEAVGLLGGGIAHDFNNVLTAIVGYGNLLKMKMAPDDRNLPFVEQILASSSRASGLTKSLLAFSRKQANNPRPMDLNDTLGRVEKLLDRIIGEDIEIRCEFASGELTILADSSQMEQVLMNLATNARDAMPQGGTLTIRSGAEIIGEEFRRIHGFGIDGTYATVSMADTGLGMEPAVLKRIFEPYFTTKERDKGTGLGLAIVYGIMKQNSGYITVESEPGKGSRFHLYFPLAAAPEQHRETAGAPGGRETIVIAEDDASLRQLMRTVLAEHGYAVIEAADGEVAVQKVRENRDTVRLVLLDVIMPRKGGREVRNEIAGIAPDARVLYITGYSTEILRSKGFTESTEHFIQKPVSPQDLLRTVRQALDRPASDAAGS